MYNGNDVSRAEEAGSDSVLVGTAGKSCYTEVCEVLTGSGQVFYLCVHSFGGGEEKALSSFTIAKQTNGVMYAKKYAACRFV